MTEQMFLNYFQLFMFWSFTLMTQTSEAAEQVPVSHHTVNERKKSVLS